MPRLLGVLPVLALLVTACKIEPRHATEPDLTIAQVLVAPDTITLDPLGTWTFGVYGRTKTNDSIPVDVQWTASAGSITQRAQFTADSSESDVTITAMLANSALTGSALVRKRRVVQLILQPARAYLLPGQTQQFSTSGVRTSGDTVAVNASYRATGGTISSSGLYTAGSTPGAYLVIATQRTLADTAVVSIGNAPVASVSVTPSSQNLYVGGTSQLSATVKDAAGNVLCDREITWSSGAPGVASVSATGLVTALSVGSATITATSEGQSGSAAISVSLVPVATVSVTPASVTLRTGTTAQLSAVTKDAAGRLLTGRSITWSSSAPTVATVSASGLVTAVAAGFATVIATSEGKSGTSAITVTVVPVASVTVTPSSGSVNVGSTLQLSAVTKDSAGNVLTGRGVTWSSSATGVATVSAAGVVSGVAAGSVTITATSEGQSGSAAITVALVPVATVSVTPWSVTLHTGTTAQLSAVAKDSAGNPLSGRTITWSTSDAGIATVSTSGLVTAVASGSATITATSEGQSGTATVTVSVVPVASVTVSPATAGIYVGRTVQLTATPKDSAGNALSGRAVTWSTSDAGIATVSTSGLVTGVARGSATITATSEGQSGTASITVTLVPVATVTVAPATKTLRIGTTVQLSATLKDSAGNVLTGRTITWSTSAPTVATVSSGLVTAVTAGFATVIATSEGKSGTSAITVTVVPVASVTVTPSSGSVNVGSTLQLSAVTKDSAGNVLTGRGVTWSSSATGVATVSAAGLVSGVAAGSVTITATSEGQSGTAMVTVSVVPVASVTVSPATAGIYVGRTVQLTATPKDSAGNALSGRVVTWSTGNASIATVSTSGLVTGVASGSATITATSEGKSGSSAITVTVVPVASVTVSPASANLGVGGTQQLGAVLKDSAGNVLTGRAVSWSSNLQTVATVSINGLVTAVAVGSATITATSEGRSGTAAIAVTAPATRAGYYVTGNGTSSGDGSAARPWDLATALQGGNGRIQAGDTVWLRAGTYRGSFTSTLTGSAAAPVVVRQYPGERVTIDVNGWTTDALTVTGSYAIYWGFEIMDSNLDRTTVTPQRPHGVVNDGAHNKYVNLVIHDMGIGMYNYSSAADLEVYGCLIYNNGWQAAKGSGHALYIKSDVGPVYLRDNILFNQFAYGVHVYTNAGSGQLNNVHVEGNVSFNNGTISTAGPSAVGANILMGGQEPVTRGTMVGNMTYFSPGYGTFNIDLGLGGTGTLNGDLVVQGNYAVGGRRVFDVTSWQSLTVSANTLVAPERPVALNDTSTSGMQWSGDMHYRDPNLAAWHYAGTDYRFNDWKKATGLAASDQATSGVPASPRVFVRPNAYERGRATVIVYNWGRQGSVLVDASGFLSPGDRYEVRNAQDFFGAPVASNTYGGGSLAIPMGGVTPPTVVGGAPTAPIKTGPDFDVFVITRVP